jgi:hypothetical protein
MNPERQRLLSLLDFAKEVAKLRVVPMWDVGKGLMFCEHEHSFQNMPGVHFNVSGSEGDVWLRVERLQEKPAPVPQDPLLAAWLSVSNTPSKEPCFKENLEHKLLLLLHLQIIL